MGKASIILGIATAIWLAWYCAAAPGAPPETPRREQLANILSLGVRGDEAEGDEDADPVRAHFEQLSEHEMKRFYVRCSEEGLARRLDGGEAMACSIGYDVLLKKHFAGDFGRLHDWSRSRQGQQMP